MPSFPRRLLTWTVVCVVSAAPSFLFGYDMFAEPRFAAAMGLGVLTFILGYTVITGTRPFARLRRHPYARRALFIGYGTRLVISIIFPIGMFLDMFCGMVSVAIAGALFSADRSIGLVYTTTMIQGAVLNVVLVAYMGAIYLVQRVFIGRLPGTGYCASCGYDLRRERRALPRVRRGRSDGKPAAG